MIKVKMETVNKTYAQLLREKSENCQKDIINKYVEKAVKNALLAMNDAAYKGHCNIVYYTTDHLPLFGESVICSKIKEELIVKGFNEISVKPCRDYHSSRNNIVVEIIIAW